MPNWCNTEVIFTGKNIKKLYNDWKRADKEIKEGDKHWLGRLFLYKNVPTEHLPYCRGFVDDIELYEYLLIRSSDAWEPMLDAYEKIADMYDLDFVIKAEEPGQGIYLNTDIEGNFFTERYIFEFFVESYVSPTPLIRKLEKLSDYMYFSSFTEISEVLSEYGVNDEQDMKYFCEYMRNKYPDYEINFHKFKEEY